MVLTHDSVIIQLASSGLSFKFSLKNGLWQIVTSVMLTILIQSVFKSTVVLKEREKIFILATMHFFLSLKYTSCTQNCGKCDLTIKACEKVNERMIKKAKN